MDIFTTIIGGCVCTVVLCLTILTIAFTLIKIRDFIEDIKGG